MERLEGLTKHLVLDRMERERPDSAGISWRGPVLNGSLPMDQAFAPSDLLFFERVQARPMYRPPVVQDAVIESHIRGKFQR